MEMQKQKQPLYKAKWILWLSLIALPPVGIILLWTCHKEMKKISKIVLSVVFAVMFIIIVSTSTEPTTPQSSTNPKATHLYDTVEIKDVINGSRTEKIGEYSIIRVSSTDITEESLTDWYFNYVSKNNYNWCMILYTDKNENIGVYSISGLVQKDVSFEKDKYGDYMLGDSSKSITYIPTNEQKLKLKEYK